MHRLAGDRRGGTPPAQAPGRAVHWALPGPAALVPLGTLATLSTPYSMVSLCPQVDSTAMVNAKLDFNIYYTHSFQLKSKFY